MSEWFWSTRPLIIAHRGASASAPENSLAAFHLALDQGADGIELDVRLSADSHLFVIHDPSVDRTTNSIGRVSELSSDQISQLMLDGEQQVPSLDMVFMELGAKTLYNVELKTHRWRDHQLIAKVLSCIQRYDLEDKVLLSSFNPIIVRDVRKQSNNAIPAALIRANAILKYGIKLTRAVADHPHRHLVTESYMAWAKRRQIPVHVWTVDNLQEAERNVRLGVRAIITNDPASLVEANLHW